MATASVMHAMKVTMELQRAFVSVVMGLWNTVIQREQPRAKSVPLENMHTDALEVMVTADVDRYV